LIVLGVADDEIYPFIKLKLALITERGAAGRPTLGVCRGA
jgi:hypothetical protein